MILIILSIIILLLNLLYFNNRLEHFTYFDLANNIDYDVPFNQFQSEVNIAYITNILDKYIQKKCNIIVTQESSLPHYDTKITDMNKLYDSYLTDLNTYILSLFDNKFDMVYSDIQNIKVMPFNYYIMKTLHVIYKPDKLYGFSFEITSSYNNKTFKLLDYFMNGTVMSDKIFLLTNKNEDPPKDVLITKSPTFEKDFLTQKYKDIKIAYGITVTP
jgi:hypothetical protein